MRCPALALPERIEDLALLVTPSVRKPIYSFNGGMPQVVPVKPKMKPWPRAFS